MKAFNNLYSKLRVRTRISKALDKKGLRLPIEDIDQIVSKVFNRVILYTLGTSLLSTLFILFVVLPPYLLNVAKDAVAKESIKEEVIKYKYNLLSDAKTEMLSIKNDLLSRFRLYDNFPINISDYGFILHDSSGKSLIMEYGSGFTNTEIFFKQPFSQTPAVYVSLSEPSVKSGFLFTNPLLGGGTVALRFLNVESDSRSFTAFFRQLRDSDVKINWIAWGK